MVGMYNIGNKGKTGYKINAKCDLNLKLGLFA